MSPRPTRPRDRYGDTGALPSAARRRPGGRSARVRASVLEAAFAVLRETGSEAFSIADVAARSGVHETSIYRRWGTKSALILEASLHFAQGAIAIPDTGALRTDLIALLDRVADVLVSPHGQALLALTASRRPDAVTARRRYFHERFDLALAIFDRAVARGEFPTDADRIGFLEALIAPLYMRLLVTGEPLDEWPRAESVDRLLAAYPPPG